MKSWKEIAVTQATSVRETIRRIDTTGTQIALVVDEQERLLGTVTDGDIRRGILRGVSLDEGAASVMNPHPTTASPRDDRAAILSMMKQRKIHHVPVVDESGRLLGLETLDELLRPGIRENLVVIMAGGLGTRLRPLTDERPKPMVNVGGRPLLETIILGLAEYGLRRFRIALNYKGDMIRAHFGDGSDFGVEVTYLEERERLGTAGALRMLDDAPEAPFLVMNGDVLTRLNFDHLLDFHAGHGAAATICVREYDFQVPFGVVTVDQHRVLGLEEKPVQRFFVSAGVYVLEPSALAHIPRDAPCDMPDLLNTLMRRGSEVSAFPIREYWLDVGHLADYERAVAEFHQFF